MIRSKFSPPEVLMFWTVALIVLAFLATVLT